MVHSDLFYISKPSLTSARYDFMFTNDLSQFTWVYFLKNKSHVFEKFKEFRPLAEKKCGRTIKFLRYNNGGEYVSQHTSVVERKNRNLVEMGRCLLKDKDLPMKFWVEVFYCSN